MRFCEARLEVWSSLGREDGMKEKIRGGAEGLAETLQVILRVRWN